MNNSTRRQFVAVSAAALGTLTVPSIEIASNASRTSTESRSICAFVKFIQQLGFDELADTMVELGFQGVEATVRPGGLIAPENARQQLPRLVEVLESRGLEVTVMTTNVTDSTRPQDRQLLEVAADLGIARYRMGYYRYDLKNPIRPQLDSVRPRLQQLAELNGQLGITGVYQNHAGARNVGSTLWDLTKLLEGVDPRQVGIAFDIRHAVVSGGTSWPILWDIARPHVRAIYCKDFSWHENRVRNVALGQGAVPDSFFRELPPEFSGVPISLHVEYLPKGGLQKNVDALKGDLRQLQQWLT